MLEQMRRSSQSLLIYVLFGIVIAVFIINFGPQSGGGCSGEDPRAMRASSAAEVDGHTIGARDFHYAYMLSGAAGAGRQGRPRELIMDALIQRELLVSEGERLGLRVGEDEIFDLISDSKIVFLGGREMKIGAMEKNGHFDHDTFAKWVQYQLQMTPAAFFEQQRKELLAAKMRSIVRGGVNVGSSELKSDYERRENQVNLEYLRFSWRGYEAEIDPSEADVAAYVKANDKKLKELYEERKVTYQNLSKQRRLRQIQVKLEPSASADASKAAEKKADALAARIKKGESFAAVARAASDDTRTKARGGEVGWRQAGATALGAEIEAKVFAAKDGEVVGPLKGGNGFYIVAVEATREGTQPFEKVRDELAEVALREEKAKVKARTDAEDVLAKATASKAKTLKDLFPAAPEAVAVGHTPSVEETGLFPRRGGQVPGIGSSAELSKSAFDLTTDKPITGPVEVAGSFIVARLKERKQPDMAEFDKKKGELLEQATLQRGSEILNEWALRRCVEVKERKRISVNPEILRYPDSPEGGPTAYEPCSPPTMRF
jgi:peptidyl-prolyl cis-trans isomerase D